MKLKQLTLAGTNNGCPELQESLPTLSVDQLVVFQCDNSKLEALIAIQSWENQARKMLILCDCKEDSYYQIYESSKASISQQPQEKG